MIAIIIIYSSLLGDDSEAEGHSPVHHPFGTETSDEAGRNGGVSQEVRQIISENRWIR